MYMDYIHCLVLVFHFRASEDTFNYNEVVH